jgi:flagellar biosynthetic protein FliR
MEPLLFSFVLVLSRVGAFVSVLPVLGGPTTPRTVKTGLAVALAAFHISTALEAGRLPAGPLVTAARLSWLACGLLVGREAVLGALLGYALGLVLLPVQVAGDYLAQEMGLSLGRLSDPGAGVSSTVLTQLLEALTVLLLLGMNVHHVFLACLYGSFVHHPVGGAFVAPGAAALTDGLARSQEWGLLLAAPLGAVLFLTTTSLALMIRAAPHMNLFSIGFSVRVSVGLGGAFLLLPGFVRAAMAVLGCFNGLLRGLV